MAGNLHQTLYAACAEVGILYRDVPPDGLWHDTDVEDDPRGRGDGRIKLFPDGQGGMVHNWKASDKPRTFFVDDGRTLSDKERAERDRRRQEAIQRAEQELARERKRAADKTAALRKIVGPARPDHPYFARKLPGTTPPTTLFETTVEQITATIGYHPHSNGEPLTGRVLIAFVETSGKLVTAEFIDEAGRKSAVAGGPKGGGYWPAQALLDSDGTGLTLAIGEGVATVLSAKEATGHAVIAALSAGNLPKVAAIMRERYPAARLIILGDTGNGQAKAEQAARDVGAALAVPRFPEGSTGTDWNDLAVLSGLDVVRGQIAALSGWKTGEPPPLSGISLEELGAAKLNPRCIVENYLYADLSLVCAPGGVGKTTTMIYEAVCIALGRSLWGLRVWNPGSTLFITAEDSRDLFVARLREILGEMDLSTYERNKVLSRVNIWDVSGDLVRLAELDQGGNIRLTGLADRIATAYKDNPPAVIVFDPAISFGPGERLINDGEQSIVTACRRIIRGLECCVRIVHHTGKANARAGATDQYASRGGTALPDGSRMVAVLSSVKDGAGALLPPPEGFELAPDDSGFVLARSKLSYAPPQPMLWIRRRGYTFEHFTEAKRNRGQETEADAEKLHQFLIAELDEERKHTGTTLETIAPSKLNIPRARVRVALATLTVYGRVTDEDLPPAERKGQRKTYLKPAVIAGKFAAESGATNPPDQSRQSNPPPYREWRNGGFESPPFPSSYSEPAASETAGLAELGSDTTGTDEIEVTV
jgi:RecA-family ATPase